MPDEQKPGTPEPTAAQPPKPGQVYQLTQEQLDELVHSKLNKQLGEHKDRWTTQTASKFEAELADLRKFKQEIEERDLSELQKAQKAQETAEARLAELQAKLHRAQWENALSGALHSAHLAGTSVLPQFVVGPELTGKESAEDMTTLAGQAVAAGYESQERALEAQGYARRGPPPTQTPGFSQPQGIPQPPQAQVFGSGPEKWVPPQLQGGQPAPGPGVQPGQSDPNANIWKRMQGIMRGEKPTDPHAPQG